MSTCLTCEAPSLEAMLKPIDSSSHGTSLPISRWMSDGARMPDEVVALYNSGQVDEGTVLAFEPNSGGVNAP